MVSGFIRTFSPPPTFDSPAALALKFFLTSYQKLIKRSCGSKK